MRAIRPRWAVFFPRISQSLLPLKDQVNPRRFDDETCHNGSGNAKGDNGRARCQHIYSGGSHFKRGVYPLTFASDNFIGMTSTFKDEQFARWYFFPVLVTYTITSWRSKRRLGSWPAAPARTPRRRPASSWALKLAANYVHYLPQFIRCCHE